MSTRGFLWTWTSGLRPALEEALRKEGYRPWEDSLAPNYMGQQWEVIRVTWTSSTKGTCAWVTPAKHVHHWGLRTSESSNATVLSTYREPGEHWVAKCYEGGRPLWKTREEVDMEVSYPIPLLTAERASRSKTAQTQSEGEWHDEIVHSWSRFQRFWGLDIQAEFEPEQESIWIQRDSPLWSNHIEEKV